MKILYVTDGIAPYVVGGMQAVSRRQITGLASYGIDVHYVHSFRGKPRQETDLPGEEHVLDYPFRKGFSRLSPMHYPNELISYSEEVDAIVRKVQPDVIYSEGPLVHKTLSRVDRPPVVFHPHGLDMFQNQMSFIRNLRARTLRPIFGFHSRRAERVFTQGGCLTEILTNTIGVPKERVTFLPNAVPGDAKYEAKGRSGDILKCLFVGRDDPKKGFGLLRQALNSSSRMTLDVVGMDGEDTRKLRWHGVVRDPERIRKFYQDADVLVLSSYSEGMATVLLEAMQAGTPSIATDVGASREVVINEKTGWLIQPGSAILVAEAIQQAAAMKEEEYLRFSGNCLAHVNDNFSAAVVTRRLVELLCEVAAKPTMNRN
ncbi:MAG: glycosyltransferase family 4 protein [Akkermansiaceae bacterium]|nr:glycosyltransferase family 4 protein [Akkermansiaceae bacterium]